MPHNKTRASRGVVGLRFTSAAREEKKGARAEGEGGGGVANREGSGWRGLQIPPWAPNAMESKLLLEASWLVSALRRNMRGREVKKGIGGVGWRSGGWGVKKALIGPQRPSQAQGAKRKLALVLVAGSGRSGDGGDGPALELELPGAELDPAGHRSGLESTVQTVQTTFPQNERIDF